MNANEPVSNTIPSPTLKLWVPVVITNSPVAGSYDALVGLNCTLGPDLPTFTVIVSLVTDLIPNLVLYAGWPTEGNLCSVLLSSIVQVNTNESGLI